MIIYYNGYNKTILFEIVYKSYFPILLCKILFIKRIVQKWIINISKKVGVQIKLSTFLPILKTWKTSWKTCLLVFGHFSVINCRTVFDHFDKKNYIDSIYSLGKHTKIFIKFPHSISC